LYFPVNNRIKQIIDCKIFFEPCLFTPTYDNLVLKTSIFAFSNNASIDCSFLPPQPTKNHQKFISPHKKSRPFFPLYKYQVREEAMMKTKIAIIALTVGAFIVTGCAGTPVAVDRFGNTQPSIQVLQPPINTNVIESETKPFFIPNNQIGTVNFFGFNDFQAGQMPLTFGLPYNLGGLTLFNGTWLMQKPFGVVFPYNQDASLSLFKSNDFQIKLMPMTGGRF
jgi:hypothetical protein